MKVNELSKSDEKTLKGRKWGGYDPIENFLNKRGYQFIDGGVYANVYSKPNSKYVIKVSKQEDECYLAFANWASKQTNNPWLPKVKFLHTFNVKPEPPTGEWSEFPGHAPGTVFTYFITAIEKLVPLNNNMSKNWDKRHLPFLAWVVADRGLPMISEYEFDFERIYSKVYKRTHGVSPSKVNRQPGIVGATGSVSRVRSYDQQSFKYADHFKKTSKLPGTIRQINQLLPKQCQDDLHSGNVMFRPGTKQLVIIDPLSELT
tara:strand:+ start:4863 stop:5642 length:780 start_codon:yes stop_codon:yes gene_type:complete